MYSVGGRKSFLPDKIDDALLKFSNFYQLWNSIVLPTQLLLKNGCLTE